MHASCSLPSTSFPQWADQDDADSYNGRVQEREARKALCSGGSSPAEEIVSIVWNNSSDRRCQRDRPSKLDSSAELKCYAVYACRNERHAVVCRFTELSWSCITCICDMYMRRHNKDWVRPGFCCLQLHVPVASVTRHYDFHYCRPRRCRTKEMGP